MIHQTEIIRCAPGLTHFGMERAGSRKTFKEERAFKYFEAKSGPLIVMVLGLPGSGKSYFAERLAEKIEAMYLCSDRLRKELFRKRTYSKIEKEKVYRLMLQKMKRAIDQNKNVVLDATFHKNKTRQLFIDNMTKDARTFFIKVRADENIIRERLTKSRPYSEAGFEVYRLIQKEWEPLKQSHLTLDSTNENIDVMLQKATQFLNDDQRADR